MKFIVFGLGNFGSSLSQLLVQLGHEVIGVDSKMETVDKYKHNITHTVALNSTSQEAVQQLPLKDIDAAIVAIGEDEGATIMTSALLKKMGVKRIICRITSPLQKIVLDAMDIKEFANPEVSSAERLALKLDLPNVIESFQISTEYRILEVEVPARYVGKTIAKLDIQNRYKVVLITTLKRVKKINAFGKITYELTVTGIVPPETVLQSDDVLLLFGSPTNLEEFILG